MRYDWGPLILAATKWRGSFLRLLLWSVRCSYRRCRKCLPPALGPARQWAQSPDTNRLYGSLFRPVYYLVARKMSCAAGWG